MRPTPTCVGVLLAATLASVSLARAEEPTLKIMGAQLKGPKAFLGDSKKVVLVVSGAGASASAELQAGRVRIDAFFRFNNKGELYRFTTFEMRALQQQTQATVESLAGGRPLTLELIVTKSGTYPINISGGTPTVEGKTELATMESKVHVDKARKVDDLDKSAGDDLGDLLTDVDAGTSGVPMFLLDRIEITRLSGPVVISALSSDRITYKPGMKGACTVTLENLSEKPTAAKM
jgi:hypothetical protein